MDNYSQCHKMLSQAIHQLGVVIEDKKIEEISELIVETMAGKSRYFHTFDHILMVCQKNEPLLTLAGLFHDLIYLSIDGKIPFNLTPYLHVFIFEKKGQFYIKQTIPNDDISFNIALQIFDLKLGDNISNFKGINEFLSALIAFQLMKDILSINDIVKLITIIELTIPFRMVNQKNLIITQQLENRLRQVNHQFNLGFSEKDIIDTIIQCVKFANLDVNGFALEDTKIFLNNTWLLLPEMNHSLRKINEFTIQDYSVALAKTTKFISHLSLDSIFHCYHNYPSPSQFEQLKQRGNYNLKFAQLYLISQVVSFSFLLGLSSQFSLSLSLSFFFNFSLNNSHQYSSLTKYLQFQDTLNNSSFNYLEMDVINLLKSPYHPSFLPPSNINTFILFIISYISFNSLDNLLPSCYLFLDHRLTSAQFLSLFPPSLIDSTSNAIALLLEEKKQIITIL